MFEPIKSLLPDLLNKHGFHEQAKTINVVQIFDTYLKDHSTEQIRTHCRGMYVQNNCFYIGVSANAAAQEIQLHKEAILAYLLENLEDSHIHDVRCKITSF